MSKKGNGEETPQKCTRGGKERSNCLPAHKTSRETKGPSIPRGGKKRKRVKREGEAQGKGKPEQAGIGTREENISLLGQGKEDWVKELGFVSGGPARRGGGKREDLGVTVKDGARRI